MSEAQRADGTPLAQAPSVTPARYQTIRAVNVRAATREWVRLRPLRAAPAMIVTTGLLSAAHFPTPRVLGVLAIQAALFVYQLIEAARAQRNGIHERSLFTSHLFFVTAQAVCVALTGGPMSPAWPSLFGSTLSILNVFGRSRESVIALAYTGVTTVVLALLPAEILGPPIARPYHFALATWSILFTIAILRTNSFALSDAYRRTGETLDKLREDLLSAATFRAQSLETMSSKVAHELKNPLSAIKGLAQLLSRGAVDDRSRERLSVITAEVSRMEVILRDYLSFSLPLTDLKTAEVDLGALTDDVFAVLEARAEMAGVSLERAGAGVTAVGDPRRLKEALLNLLSNAIEATPPSGSVTVTIATADDEAAEIVIRDTGRGLKPEDLARVGTPFFTTRAGGTGLGVVLSRSVIRQHGGDLSFASEVGRGTTVTVRLPARGCPPRSARPFDVAKATEATEATEAAVHG